MMSPRFSAFLGGAATAILSCACLQGATVRDLRCEGLVEPLGIRISGRPHFSWKLDSPVNGERQSAYQIVVDGQWDSGRIESGASLNIEYAGPALTAAKGYRWQVRVWDSQGTESEWSQPASFSTGLENWSGQWIGLDDSSFGELFKDASWIWYPEGNPAVSAPVANRKFRRTLTLDRLPTRATFEIAADNQFELFINGTRVGAGTDFSKPNSFEVASLLQLGENQIAITAGNIGAGENPAGLIARLKAEFATGEPLELVTDAQWQASEAGVNWVAAKNLGAYGMAPWGGITVKSLPLPARYLRKPFEAAADKQIARATAYVCGLGFFDLFLNGQEISDHVMDPALSNYTRGAYYVTFDVTGQVQPGANALGVMLGNGRFLAPRFSEPAVTQTFGFPKLLLQLEIEYSDGTRSTIVSDESWRLTDQGPIRTNNEYDGESYDARMEMPGWATAGFDDAAWREVQVVAAPGGALEPQMIEPMKIVRTLKPVAVTNPAPGKYIVDMGENFYGTIRLTAAGPAGQEVKMVSAYSLLPDGNLKTADNRGAACTDRYIFKGAGVETWNPRFKGQGFRHVEVTGFPGVPTVDSFEGLEIHTAVDEVGSFECSNPLINQIHAAVRRGMGMFLRSAPLDPDRDERQAWGGDPAKDAESGAYNFNVGSFYEKWMDDVARSQRADGTLPDVATFWDWGSGVEWPSVFTIIPEWLTDFYGNPRAAAKHYPAMKTWVLAMATRYVQPDGTLPATSYGDWCDAYTIANGGTSGSTPGDLISSAYHYHNLRIMERLAGDLGNTADRQSFATMADSLKTAYNAKFFNPTTDTYSGDTQCAYVLSLQFGLVPEGHREAVIQRLVDNIMVTHDGHLSVGLVGMQWLMQTLADAGRSDVAYTIATRTTRPSWGYMLSKGATTIWERWDGDTRDPSMNSEALLILAGNLDAWFYQSLAGIQPVEQAFRKISIQPQIVGDLTWAKGRFDSPYGIILSDWKIESPERVSLDCTLPPNTTGVIGVPLATLTHATIRLGGKAIWSAGRFLGGVPGVAYEGADAKAARFVVGAGTYTFSVTGTPAAPVAQTVIVDNDDPAAVFEGSWVREVVSEQNQRYGASFAYAAAGTGTSRVTFRPDLPVAGDYQVSMRWTAHPNRATNAPLAVHHAGGDSPFPLNQEANGGVWNLVGTFHFEAGTAGFVTLNNAANQYVIADAVKFEPVLEAGSGEPGLEEWIAAFFPAGSDTSVTGPEADPDGDGASNLAEIAFGSDPSDPARRTVQGYGPGPVFTLATLRGATFHDDGSGSQSATVAGMTYQVSASRDLTLWMEPLSDEGAADEVAGWPDLSSTAWEYHRFRLTDSIEPPAECFFRATATAAP